MRLIFALFLIIGSTCVVGETNCPGGTCDGFHITPSPTFIALVKEKDFQNTSCRGEIEFILPDRTRVDCLTDSHAIEFDFGTKWAEAVGQSLYYAFQTNKKAGIVLIFKKPEDVRYHHRLMSVIEHNKLNIDVWVIHGY